MYSKRTLQFVVTKEVEVITCDGCKAEVVGDPDPEKRLDLDEEGWGQLYRTLPESHGTEEGYGPGGRRRHSLRVTLCPACLDKVAQAIPAFAIPPAPVVPAPETPAQAPSSSPAPTSGPTAAPPGPAQV